MWHKNSPIFVLLYLTREPSILKLERGWLELFKNIGGTEIIIVAVILLILFGGKKLPELARGLAESIKEFRKALKGEEEEKPKEE